MSSMEPAYRLNEGWISEVDQETWTDDSPDAPWWDTRLKAPTKLSVEMERNKNLQAVYSVKELEDKDPDSVILDSAGRLTFVREWWLSDDGETSPEDGYFMPAVIVADGKQIRAARKLAKGRE